MKYVLQALFCVCVLAGCSKNNVETGKNSAMTFIKVAGGTFTMGSEEEKPIHQVSISDFQMAVTEVTQAQWQAVMGNNPSNHAGKPNSENRPVENVSWLDAINFCNALSLKEGLSPAYSVVGKTVNLNVNPAGYRLPTEAEWEYAARGGSKPEGTAYSGSDDIAAVAWYEANSAGTTQPVALKAANSLGLFDMSGNVWEWCWDWSENYDPAVVQDPVGAAAGKCRVPRGGGWYGTASQCTVAVRYCYKPYNMNFGIGFRVVRP